MMINKVSSTLLLFTSVVIASDPVNTCRCIPWTLNHLPHRDLLSNLKIKETPKNDILGPASKLNLMLCVCPKVSESEKLAEIETIQMPNEVKPSKPTGSSQGSGCDTSSMETTTKSPMPEKKPAQKPQSQCSCIVVDDCPSIAALLRKPIRTEQETQALQSARCGWDERGRPKVSCCDRICYTPEGLPGRCADYRMCPHLSALVNQMPIPQDDLTYLQQSVCQGPGVHDLCCGPPRGTAPREPQQCPPSAAIPDKNSDCCGRDANNENRIIGGNATAVDQYPWLALIEYRGYDRTIKLMCGAVLISSRYVLTAGHCIKGAVRSFGTPVNIRLGEYDTTNEGPDCVPVEARGKDCTEGIVTIPIGEMIPHPEYRPERNRNNDIGLIRMKQLAPFTEFIRPICLPTEDLSLNPPKDFRMFVAGWGAINNKISKSNVKLHVDVPFVPLATCKKAYDLPSRKAELVREQICAGGELKKDSCRGDSGGPLMYENEETRVFEVTGIVSFGSTPCGLENVPGVYTNVFQYDSWIRSQIRP